jgi:hypothetical protein
VAATALALAAGVAFGREGTRFPAKSLHVTTFGGELLELRGAR